MYVLEFGTDIENGIVQISEKYPSLQSVKAEIIILAKDTAGNTTFYTSVFLD